MDNSSDLQGSWPERANGMEAHLDKRAWVVKLSHGKESDVKYVRARTQSGAIDTARCHSRLPSSADAYVRLATPHDLGCTERSRD